MSAPCQFVEMCSGNAIDQRELVRLRLYDHTGQGQSHRMKSVTSCLHESYHLPRLLCSKPIARGGIMTGSPPSHARQMDPQTHLHTESQVKVAEHRSVRDVLKLKSLSITCSIARWYSSWARLDFHAATGCSKPFSGIFSASTFARGL